MSASATGGAAGGGRPGPDFDRFIDRPPINVLPLPRIGNEGTVTEPASATPHRTRGITKIGGHRSSSIAARHRPVMEVEPSSRRDRTAKARAPENSTQCLRVGSSFETPAGVALSLVPILFLQPVRPLMDEMADDIAAGRPLDPLGFAIGRAPPQLSSSTTSRSPSHIRSQQRDASEPTHGRPMLDRAGGAATFPQHGQPFARL